MEKPLEGTPPLCLEAKGETLLNLLIRRCNKKMREVDVEGFGEDGVRNVSENFKIVVPLLEKARGGSFESIRELIDCLNGEAEGTHFIENDEEIQFNGARNYRVKEIFLEMDNEHFDRMEKEHLSYANRSNFWDNPPNAQELFLPVSYLLKEESSQ